MTKGLFTSNEEISFQYKYVQGNVKPVREPNAGRNPVKNGQFICGKKTSPRFMKSFCQRTR